MKKSLRGIKVSVFLKHADEQITKPDQPRKRTPQPFLNDDQPRNPRDDGNHGQHHYQANMLGIPSDPLIKAQYLPTDNVGRLYCWDCWERLKDEAPALHNARQEETCDGCGKEIDQGRKAQRRWKETA